MKSRPGKAEQPTVRGKFSRGSRVISKLRAQAKVSPSRTAYYASRLLYLFIRTT